MTAWERLLPRAAFHPANQVAGPGVASAASPGSEKVQAGLSPAPPPSTSAGPPEHSKGWLSRLSPVSAGEGPNLERILDRELVGVCHTHHVHYSHSSHDL